MTEDEALGLARMTNRFYATVAPSFSATRERGWDGWATVYEQAADTARGGVLDVLDVAAGNLRFERALADALPGLAVAATCIDSCPALAPEGVRATLVEADVTSALAHGCLDEACGDGHDLSVCFGFAHHVPHPDWREELLRALLRATRPGGIVAASFWMFGRSDRIMAKAREATDAARFAFLGPGDWLLGWQGRTDALRYCHAFTEDEIDGLVRDVADLGAPEAVWDADGREGNLNRYVALRRV